MNRIHKACLCVLLPLLCAAASGLGQAPVAQDITDGDDSFDEGPQRPAHSISELDWLAGRWVGQGLGGDVEEIWSPPSAGSMVGMFPLVDDYKTSFCEFLMIEEKDGLVTLRFKHFNSGYESWERRSAAAAAPRPTPTSAAVFRVAIPSSRLRAWSTVCGARTNWGC